MKSIPLIVSFAVVVSSHPLATLRKVIEHVPETESYQRSPQGMQRNVQYFLFEIMQVSIQGKVGRVLSCAPRLGQGERRHKNTYRMAFQ